MSAVTGRERHHVAPENFTAVTQQNVIEILYQGCVEDPFRPALIIEDGLVISRQELLDRSQRFAGYLARFVKPHDRVVVMLDNRVEFMIALFAIVANRGILVSIAPTAQEHDAGHILKDSTPIAAIVG